MPREIDVANRLIDSLLDPSVRDLIDRDLTTEDAALAAVVLGDELGSFRPPIANVDGQSVVGLFAGRGPCSDIRKYAAAAWPNRRLGDQ